ncbi:hypothetical protein QFC21_001626 [Naganishia friedmannii]|uniref:Uncharacterized protein n=1 Tax=Naganishia friedmannii TaxID=89922 RepID=A0ACC2W1R9_9TREE|nr:hypothetical protein QFC21_001626 [Naganishia friedmannii]
MANVNHQPIPTLYINNLESKVKKDELRRQLYALFVPYGKILDVVAAKGSKMRGQAFVVFEEISAATAAMRALVGEEFYGRPLHEHSDDIRGAAVDRLKKTDPVGKRDLGSSRSVTPLNRRDHRSRGGRWKFCSSDTVKWRHTKAPGVEGDIAGLWDSPERTGNHVLRITYAKSTSNASLLHEDPEAALTQANKKLRKEDRTIASRAQGAYEDLERERQEEEEGRGKRERGENGDVEGQSEGDDDAAADAPEKKRRKVDADAAAVENGGGADADEEEMEMDDE